MRLAQIDIYIGGQSESLVPGHPTPPIPSQRTIKFFWQLAGLFDQRLNDAVTVFVADLCQHHKTGVPLDQCGEEAIARARNQVSFPVTWYGPIFDFCRPVSD